MTDEMVRDAVEAVNKRCGLSWTNHFHERDLLAMAAAIADELPTRVLACEGTSALMHVAMNLDLNSVWRERLFVVIRWLDLDRIIAIRRPPVQSRQMELFGGDL